MSLEANKIMESILEEQKSLKEKCYKKGLCWDKAEYNILEAAIHGDADAQYILGSQYDKEERSKDDEKKMAFWYEKAAIQGHTAAQSSIAFCYELGLGVGEDKEKAEYWYKHAAIQGNDAFAQYNLGLMYNMEDPRDYESAAFWYEKAASQGYSEAESAIAFMYIKGLGVPKNYEKAAYWYQKAAKNDADAQLVMGFLYHKGKGVLQDYEKAEYWYKQAAQHNINATYILGLMYYNRSDLNESNMQKDFSLEQVENSEDESKFLNMIFNGLE